MDGCDVESVRGGSKISPGGFLGYAETFAWLA
jgi:hypothetical protein